MSLASAAERPWALDREIVIARVFDAPRPLVFQMWTDPEHAMKWFGPKGFSCTLYEMNVRVGGLWRFDMTAPNGTVYPNRIEYLEIVPNERIVFDHGRDIDDDPTRFRVTLTFDEQADKKTVVTLRQLHPTKEQRDAGIGFGAVELGNQTMDKLADHLRTQQ
jgi:uncharacterized protein YndB with AHSA1/START domain